MKGSNYNKAIQLIQKASNTELEKFIFKYTRRDVNVNFLTRSLVEAKVIKELDVYTEEQIAHFLTKLI